MIIALHLLDFLQPDWWPKCDRQLANDYDDDDGDDGDDDGDDEKLETFIVDTLQ